jgi:hypothetical protein
MRLEDIYFQNPWWDLKENIDNDRHIKIFNQCPYKYYPDFYKTLEMGKTGIYTLRGPRQIGKTTTMKLLIKKLIDQDQDPSNILYLTLDNIQDKEELIETLKNWILLRQKTNTGRLYIFLDEISFISNWQTAMKYLSDINLLSQSFVLLSGSSAYDIKNSTERLPGRRGAGDDYIQLPVSFKDFVQGNHQVEIKRWKIADILKLTESELKLLAFEYGKHQVDFTFYCQSGGFPKVINTYIDNNMITEEVIKIYEDFILGDIERFSKSRFTLIELLKKIPDIIGQQFSWNSLNNEMNSISSSNTVESYFQILGMNFIIATLFFLDPSKGSIKPKKQKKIYPIDPIVSKVIERLSGKMINQGHYMESIVLENLLQFSSRKTEGLNLYYGPYYWYSQKKKEIDFLIEQSSELYPIEVKYQTNINKSDYATLKRNFNKGILLTKDTTFKDGKIIVLPISLFLLLI